MWAQPDLSPEPTWALPASSLAPVTPHSRGPSLAGPCPRGASDADRSRLCSRSPRRTLLPALSLLRAPSFSPIPQPRSPPGGQRSLALSQQWGTPSAPTSNRACNVLPRPQHAVLLCVSRLSRFHASVMCQCIRSITSDIHSNPGVMPIVKMGKLRLREPKTPQLAVSERGTEVRRQGTERSGAGDVQGPGAMPVPILTFKSWLWSRERPPGAPRPAPGEKRTPGRQLQLPKATASRRLLLG